MPDRSTPVTLVVGDMQGRIEETFGRPAWERILAEYREYAGSTVAEAIEKLKLEDSPEPDALRGSLNKFVKQFAGNYRAWPVPILIDHGLREDVRKHEFATRLLGCLCEFDVWGIIA